MNKTKAKTKLIMILNALLGVVFAFMVGYTLCVDPTKTARTQQGSTAAYLANNSWQVVNGTIENPIMFGPGAHNTKVAIEYSLNYNFDVRIKYSLEWSDKNLSTDNVILNYADRDRFIVDEEYIYLTDLIVAEKTESADTRHGTLNIFTGVEFVNPEDETYFGETLTINVEVEIAKEETISYNANASSTPKSMHPLYVDSIAGNAWAKYRSGAFTGQSNADIIVYNSRYYDGDTIHNGIEYPDAVTAYKYSTASGKDTTRLYGNRYYAGVGLYVLAGKSDVVITVKSMGNWQKISDYVLNTNSVWKADTYYSKSGDSYTLLTTEPGDWDTNYSSYYVANIAAAFENNIYYNFDSNWATVTHDSNHTISSIKVAAGKAVYINVYDSIEITSVMETEAEIINYSGYRLVSSFYLNNSLMSGKKIDYLTNVSSSGANVSSTYSGADYSIINTSTYNPIWVDNTSTEPTFTEQATNVAITNNTATSTSYKITYKSKYTTSNGSQVLRTDGGFETDLTSTEWARADFYGEQSSVTVEVAPYSTVSLLNDITAKYSVTGSSLHIGDGYYDAWLSYEIVSVTNTADTTTTDSISVEVKNNGSTKEVYLRNNSNETISIPASSVVNLKNWVYNYKAAQVAPQWDVNYWRYFYNNNGNYVRATKTSQWAIGTYYLFEKSFASETITISSEITLVPNSTAFIGWYTFNGTVVSYDGSLVTSQNASKTSIVEEGGVGIVNNGTTSAYVVNNTTNSYYIRFKSSYDNDTNENTFIVNDSYCYYIGVLRPGQMLEVPCNGNRIGGGNSSVDVIVANKLFDIENCSDLGNWANITDVANAFKNYFS